MAVGNGIHNALHQIGSYLGFNDPQGLMHSWFGLNKPGIGQANPQAAPMAGPSAYGNPNPQATAQNDAMARRMGFQNGAQAAAYYQKQQEMRTGAPNNGQPGGGSLWDTMFAAHPAMLLQRVNDAFTKAGQ